MTKFLILFFTTALFLTGCAGLDSKFTKEPTLQHDDINKISLAIESDNLEALKAIFGKLPAKQSERSFADENTVNSATIKVASVGEKCNKDIIDYLITQGGDVYFNSGSYVGENSYMRAFCGSYLLNYVNKPSPEHTPSVAAGNSTSSYNNFIGFINGKFDMKDTDLLITRLQKYKEIIFAAYGKASNFCSTAPVSEPCLSSGIYKKLPDDLTEKVKIDNASQKFKEFWSAYLKELKAKF